MPCLPAVDFLQPTPRLAQLALLCLPNPAAFVHVPQLVHLDLSLDWGPAALPPGFLTHIPRLTRLSLRRAGLAALPPDLLAPVPQLTHFELHGAGGPDGLTTLPPGLLAPVPRLTHLALRLELPPPRPPAPQPLQTLLPPDFLASVPQLTHLSLECAPPLPPDFLASVPRLTHLTLCFGYQNREPLAADFLTPVPRLTHLTLEAFFALPPDFLAPVPRLTHLIEAVPPFPYALQYVPRLTHLEMRWNGQPLASLPYLIQAKLRVPSASPLPSDFLAYAPRLERLEVYAPRVQALPRDFLAHAPRLERLEVYASRVQALPPSFLAYAPRLTYLNLHDVKIPSRLGVSPDGIAPWAPALTTVPDDFLAYAPRLTYLNLPVRRLVQVPLQVQEHLRDHGTLAVVDVPWGHVHFPTGDPGLCARPALRYPIVDGERDVWFASPVAVDFACPEASAWQPAPQTLCRPPALLRAYVAPAGNTAPIWRVDALGNVSLRAYVAPAGNAAASGRAAPAARGDGVAWVDGLVVALHAQPNRRSAVTGHACRGDVVRIEARYGDGAWLRVRLVDQFFFPDEIRESSSRYTRIYWIPATAVRPWLPEDPIPPGCPFRG